MSGSKPHEESDSPASSQTITIGSKGIAVSLRRFLADIAPGMFLLLIVYLYGEAHGQKFLDLTSEGAAYRMVFYLLIAIPAGFIVNATSYYVLGGVVRSLEGLMLRSNFICGKMVTICDWEEVKKFFKLDSDKNGSDYLIFRYNCQSVIAKRDKEWFATIDVGGVEMLSRSMAFLSAVYVALVLFYWRDPLNIAVPLGLAAAAFFLLLSAFDSLYIGVRCIRYLLVICKNDLDKKEGHSWDKVLSLLPSTADRTKT